MKLREEIEKLTEERDAAKANHQLGMYLRIKEIDTILEMLNYLEQILRGSED